MQFNNVLNFSLFDNNYEYLKITNVQENVS